MKFENREEFEKNNMFGIGAPNTAYAKYFVGNSYLNPLTDPNGGLFAANVTFEPGCRNNYHIHRASKGGGQLLICTAGEGWYVEEGKKAVDLHEGSVVMIPANVKHWHGAKKDSWFSHIAVEVPGENTKNEWCEPVSDEEYNKLSEYDAANAPDKITQTAGRNSLGKFAPEFAHFNDDVLFGENWNNGDIDLKTRSIITVVALLSEGITDSSLKYHLLNAKNHGVTQKEIAAIITHTAFYAGWPKAWAAFNLAKEVWNEE